MTSGNVPKIGDRIEWNSTGDAWEPATVVRYVGCDHVRIQLDGNRQSFLVDLRHCRRPEVETGD